MRSPALAGLRRLDRPKSPAEAVTPTRHVAVLSLLLSIHTEWKELEPMADQQVDARGLSCPEPVLLARKAIESVSSGTIEVLVDTATPKENVTRLAKNRGCSVSVEEVEGEFRLTITKG